MKSYLCHLKKILLCLMISGQIYAQDQNQQLESLVQNFVMDHIEHKDDERINVQITSINSQTKLSPCATPIDVSYAENNNQTQSNAVVLQCHTEPKWSIYVPISIKILSKVVAAGRLISPGDTITEADLNYEEYDKNKLYDGYFTNFNQVLGLSVVRSISAGTALTKRNLRQMVMIKRNQNITLVIKNDAFEIVMNGIAKSDAYLNETVKILNTSSKKIIDAVVIGPNKAQIIS